MQKIILSVLLFLIILCNPVVAETGVYELDYDITNSVEEHSGANAAFDLNPARWKVADVETMATLDFLECNIKETQWEGSSETSSWDWINLYSDAGLSNKIGTGVYGYIKSPSTNTVRVQLHIGTNLDWGVLIGEQVIYMGESDNLEDMTVRYFNVPTVSSQSILLMHYLDNSVGSLNSALFAIHTARFKYTFSNPYEYSYNDEMGCLNYTLYRNVSYPSKLYIHNSNTEIINETSVQTDDYVTYSFELDYPIWDTNVTTENGNVVSIEIDFSTLSNYPGEDRAGAIEFNQTSYTEPELIQIDVELTTYDFTDHSYYIITEVSEDLDFWDNVAGTYNGTTKITTTSESRTLDVDTWLYDLPIWIRSRLVDYNKLTGEYTTLDTTPAVLFNPPTPGSIKFGGTVIDSDTNQIISGALVSVDGVTTTSDTTNAFGEFLIYLYPGIYTVTTSKTGYQTSTSEDLLMEFDNTWAQIYLTPIGYGNGTLYGNVNDANTGYAIKDVHVIITNATDQIDAYTSSGGYYEATGLAQSSTYTIQAVKSGYYTYNGSVTTETSGASHKSFNMVSETATPTPTATVLPTTTYPGGEGHEWTNDEIVTMLRVIVPGFFLLMLVFLLLAVMLGLSGNNGNNGQGRSGLGELWRR